MRYILDEICLMQSGGTPSRGEPLFFEGNIPWAKIADFENAVDGVLSDTEESISEYGLKSINNRIFEKGTLLLAMYGSIGKVVLTGKPMSCNQAILAINPKDSRQVNIKYLKYWFEFQEGYLNSQGQGAILQNVSLTIIKRQSIDLPDLLTQNKIVGVLDKVNLLIKYRNESVDLYNQLLSSSFIDLFGDPIRNYRNWPVKHLKDVARLERGKFSARPRNDPSFFDGKYPFIQTGDINNSNYRLKRYTQTLNEKGIEVSKMFFAGDIVVAIVGATIGATSILKIDTYATDSIIAIMPGEELSNVFLEMLMRFYRKVLLDKAPQAARANINLEILGKLVIVMPPTDLQSKYVELTDKIENEITKATISKEQITNLYKTLLQKALTSGINLNVDFELEALINEIKLDKRQNDLSKISANKEYLKRLVNKLNNQEFKKKGLYDKAKHTVFQLLKEEHHIFQEFNKEEGKLKLLVR